MRTWDAPSPDLLGGEVPLSLGKHFIANHEFPNSSRAQKWRVIMSVQLPVVPFGPGL